MGIKRLKNRTIAKVITRFPFLSRKFINSYRPLESEDIPWTPVRKLLNESKVAIVTTAGVHHKDQQPFDMADSEGDPTFRVINMHRPVSNLIISHDYYDHSDADKDINIVFPIERLREFEKESIIGKAADINYGFMGHITGQRIKELTEKHAPDVAQRLKSDNVDVVLLTPG